MHSLSRRLLTPHAMILFGFGIGLVWVLRVMGRVWWCQAGDWLPWSWDVHSRHNSQHFVDPYSLSHIEHGIGLFLVLSGIFRRRISVATSTVMVAFVEIAWEAVENTDWVVNRYREVTISLNYFGDSVMNSLSDYVMCLGGVWIARRASLGFAITCFLGLEVISVLWIRDSLLLNILMLFVPIEAIGQWQVGVG